MSMTTEKDGMSEVSKSSGGGSYWMIGAALVVAAGVGYTLMRKGQG